MRISNTIKRVSRIVMGSLIVISMLSLAPAQAATFFINIPGPTGSMDFGTSVTVLPNGNFVVTDPRYDYNKGAVYLYNPNSALISRLTGSIGLDSVGSGGITVLSNGNYVVSSPSWSGSVSTYGLGAVTWCNQLTGCNGTVSSSNSLVGSVDHDQVGYGGISLLTNGNYVVSSPRWDNGNIENAGAVTWGNGTGGTVGVVSYSNSLIGSTLDDQVGFDFYGGVKALTYGNYLVLNSAWDNGSVVDAGAITWGNGAGGTVGAVSASNSLVGSTEDDQVGSGKVIELTNGNYVVINSLWDLDESHPNVGAVTWGSGTAGVAGPISASNSLVGISSIAHVGDSSVDNYGVTALNNGNYVVSSPNWSPDGSGSHFGAVTWGSGAMGVTGAISTTNSLVGSYLHDYVGSEVIPLSNGNYVVSSPICDLDETHYNTGAVTWGNGASGITGQVSLSNSLVGNSLQLAGDGGVIALTNGNYVVSTPAWNNNPHTPINVGAVTWGDGTIGTTGLISTTNSLVGDFTYASVGDGGLVALTNGNYVVINQSWDNGSIDGAGAVTWADGSHMTTGVVSTANSLVGSTANDKVGDGLWSSGVIALTNGNYVVSSPLWDNGAITDAGAITWGNGTVGTAGAVSASNSLVGTTADDQLGSVHWDGGVTALTNGNYVVSIPQWDNGSTVDAGAVVWGNGAGGTVGAVSASNSLVGSTSGDNVGNGSFFGAAGVTELSNGDYLVNSPDWSDASDVGAITLGDGTSGVTGMVSPSNSLVNSCASDQPFCSSTLTAFSDGNASIHFPNWNNGNNFDGAVSLIACNSSAPVGAVSAANSVLGTTQLGGSNMVSDYDGIHAQLIVGRPADNIVTIMRCLGDFKNRVYLPTLIK